MARQGVVGRCAPLQTLQNNRNVPWSLGMSTIISQNFYYRSSVCSFKDLLLLFGLIKINKLDLCKEEHEEEEDFQSHSGLRQKGCVCIKSTRNFYPLKRRRRRCNGFEIKFKSVIDTLVHLNFIIIFFISPENLFPKWIQVKSPSGVCFIILLSFSFSLTLSVK